MAIERAIAKAKMPAAIRAGQSVTGFIAQMRKEGLSYDVKAMQKDYRSAAKTIQVEGALQKLTPSQRPSAKTMAEVEWNLSREYLYKVKVMVAVKGQTKPKERFVNILSDVKLSMRQIEREVREKWRHWEDYGREVIATVTPWTAYHRA